MMNEERITFPITKRMQILLRSEKEEQALQEWGRVMMECFSDKIDQEILKEKGKDD